MESTNPVLVEVTRGAQVESRHRGAVAVADAGGALVAAWGDVARPVYPRSAVKALQALPLVETGAADRFGLGQRELALACASHAGEAVHTQAVAAWLARIGLEPAALACGVQAPRDEAAARALARADQAPTALHHNCSGKHTGMLATAVHLGEPTRGYLAADHPVQRRVGQAIAEMAGIDLATAPVGTDGCGLPTIALPLEALARAMARLSDPGALGPARAEAARRLFGAMTAEPRMVGGRGRFDTLLIEAMRGALAVKVGAEGVHVAIVPARGLGVAVKIDDGARRASEVAVGAVLCHLGILDAAARAVLAPLLEPRVPNDAGREVGRMRAAADWLG